MGSKSTGKKDYFGRPMKEKFPYYPYGVIIPRCTAGPCNRHPPSQKPNTATTKPCRRPPPTTTTSTTRQRPHTHDPECTQSKHKNAGKNTSSSEACKRIARIVADELPNCKFDPKFLKEIECKCKNYWDTLRRHSIYLDEKQVAKELKRKLHEWALENKQECCDDDDDDNDDDDDGEENSGGPSRKPSNHEIEQENDSQNESNLNSTTNQSNSNFYNANDEVDNNEEDEILDYFDEDEDEEEESDYMDFQVSRFPIRSWRNVEEEEEDE